MLHNAQEHSSDVTKIKWMYELLFLNCSKYIIFLQQIFELLFSSGEIWLDKKLKVQTEVFFKDRGEGGRRWEKCDREIALVSLEVKTLI